MIRVLILAALLLVACSPSPTGQGTPTVDRSDLNLPSPAAPRHTPPLPDITATGIDAGLGPYIDLAKADLADRLGVSADSLSVVRAVLVTWPDASLGCPEPGKQYAQVATDGALIELAGPDDKSFRYHAGGDSEPFGCPRT